MANSVRFRELVRRLEKLRRNLLPGKFSPTGSYSERQLDRARGYRLLAHAEIEAFIEDITLATAKGCVASWVKTKRASHALLCLIAHYHSGFDDDEEGLQPKFPETSRPKTKDAIQEIVQIALKQYITIHDNNHGVREKNIKRLLLPVGVKKEDIDPTWLTNIDEFGKQRGELAHKTIKVHQEIDPKGELNTISDLLVGLDAIDKAVRSIR